MDIATIGFMMFGAVGGWYAARTYDKYMEKKRKEWKKKSA